MTDILSLPYVTMNGASFTDFADAAAAAGFRSVGGFARPGRLDAMPELISLTEAKANRRYLDDLGLTVLDVGGVVVREDTDVSQAGALIDIAHEIGGQYIIVPAYDPDASRMADKFAALCDLAAPAGLDVVIEFGAHMGIRTLDQAFGLLRNVGRPNGGVTLDTLLWFRSGGTVDDVARLDPAWPLLVQLCDGPAASPPVEALRTESLTARNYAGEGDLPLGPLLSRLKPDLPISVEVPTALNDALTPLEIARRAFVTTERLLATARSRATA